jgi:hypothetical protein
MNYKEIEIESYGTKVKHIIIDNGDGSFKSFPADESNPEYLAFLEATAKPAKAAKAKPIVEPEASEAE